MSTTTGVAPRRERGPLQFVKRVATLLFHYLPGTIWLLISLFAVGWLVMSSLKTNREIFAGIWDLPKSLFLDGYERVFQQMSMARYMLNSAVLSIVVVGIVALISSMASYVLTRFEFKGSRLILTYFMAGMSIPGLLIVVPLYLLLNKLGLLNNLWGLGLVYVATSLPFSIFVLTGFFRTIPTEIIDAGIVDGASDFGVFWKIAFPLARPGITTISIFNFLGVWNEYLLALMLVHRQEWTTLPLGLYQLRMQQQMSTDWTSMFAGVVIAMVPSLIIFLLLQERLAAGLTTGALKG
jgi:ABC-type glycerol-3-phosphate transport system permease component